MLSTRSTLPRMAAYERPRSPGNRRVVLFRSVTKALPGWTPVHGIVVFSGDCPVAVALKNLLAGLACGQRSSLSAFAVCDTIELLPIGQPAHRGWGTAWDRARCASRCW